MDPILEPFTNVFKNVRLKPPQIPYISNLTGTWITSSVLMNPGYWANHLRQTVRFAQGVGPILREQPCILLEVGSGQTLSTFARWHPDKTAEHIVLSSLRPPLEQKSDTEFILNTLGQLWLLGVKIDSSGFYAHERRNRIPLPTYPFERQRYWIEGSKPAVVGAAEASPLKKPDVSDWFYVPSWKQSTLPKLHRATPVKQKFRWLVFGTAGTVESQITDRKSVV